MCISWSPHTSGQNQAKSMEIYTIKPLGTAGKALLSACHGDVCALGNSHLPELVSSLIHRKCPSAVLILPSRIELSAPFSASKYLLGLIINL